MSLPDLCSVVLCLKPMVYPNLLTTRQSQNISKPLVPCLLDMKRLHQLGLHVQSLCHRLTHMDLRRAMIVLVRANAIDAAMAGCSWCKYVEEEHTAFLCDRGEQMCRKAAAEYCRNSLAAIEFGTSSSSIQWTTLLLCFVGVIFSFKAERRVMVLPCKGESFCAYNTFHVCAKELWDFTLQTRSSGAASDLHRAT